MLMKVGLVLVLIVLALTLFKKKRTDSSAAKKDEVEETAVEMKQDPVCGSFVEESTKYKVKYYDKIYYFCSQECMDKFIEQKKDENRS